MAIYKREDEKSDWTPFQYFSGNCLDTFNVSESREVPDSQPDKVLCSKEFSDISPLSGGNVIFSTLENRPSNKRYDQNAELQVSGVIYSLQLCSITTVYNKIVNICFYR